MNLEKLLKEYTSGISEDDESGTSVVEKLKNHILRDVVSTFGDFIMKSSREIKEADLSLESMLCSINYWEYGNMMFQVRKIMTVLTGRKKLIVEGKGLKERYCHEIFASESFGRQRR